jgi:hypothetical protein
MYLVSPEDIDEPSGAVETELPDDPELTHG